MNPLGRLALWALLGAAAYLLVALPIAVVLGRLLKRLGDCYPRRAPDPDGDGPDWRRVHRRRMRMSHENAPEPICGPQGASRLPDTREGLSAPPSADASVHRGIRGSGVGPEDAA